MTTADAIFLFGLLVLSIGLMWMGYQYRRPSVAITSAVAWLAFGIYARSLSTVLWDIEYIMFILGICLFFVGFIEGLMLRPKVEDTDPDEDLWDRETQDWIDKRTKWREKMSAIMDVSKRHLPKRQVNIVKIAPPRWEDDAK